MDELLIFVVQYLLEEKLIATVFVGAVGFGLLGFMLYSNVKEITDSWDKFLKDLSIVMMVIAGIAFVWSAVLWF